MIAMAMSRRDTSHKGPKIIHRYDSPAIQFGGSHEANAGNTDWLSTLGNVLCGVQPAAHST